MHKFRSKNATTLNGRVSTDGVTALMNYLWFLGVKTCVFRCIQPEKQLSRFYWAYEVRLSLNSNAVGLFYCFRVTAVVSISISRE